MTSRSFWTNLLIQKPASVEFRVSYEGSKKIHQITLQKSKRHPKLCSRRLLSVVKWPAGLSEQTCLSKNLLPWSLGWVMKVPKKISPETLQKSKRHPKLCSRRLLSVVKWPAGLSEQTCLSRNLLPWSLGWVMKVPKKFHQKLYKSPKGTLNSAQGGCCLS